MQVNHKVYKQYFRIKYEKPKYDDYSDEDDYYRKSKKKLSKEKDKKYKYKTIDSFYGENNMKNWCHTARQKSIWGSTAYNTNKNYGLNKTYQNSSKIKSTSLSNIQPIPFNSNANSIFETMGPINSNNYKFVLESLKRNKPLQNLPLNAPNAQSNVHNLQNNSPSPNSSAQNNPSDKTYTNFSRHLTANSYTLSADAHPSNTNQVPFNQAKPPEVEIRITKPRGSAQAAATFETHSVAQMAINLGARNQKKSPAKNLAHNFAVIKNIPEIPFISTKKENKVKFETIELKDNFDGESKESNISYRSNLTSTSKPSLLSSKSKEKDELIIELNDSLSSSHKEEEFLHMKRYVPGTEDFIRKKELFEVSRSPIFKIRTVTEERRERRLKEEINERERKYVCKLCGKAYLSGAALYLHGRRKH